MIDYALNKELQSLAELNNLRKEAMRLFEDCLTNGDTTALVKFVEQQITQTPPRLHLLREIADDLQQRLLSLREHHFDVRERVIAMLAESYHIDITRLAPPDKLECYHSLSIESIMQRVHSHADHLQQDELIMLHKMIAVSLEMAGQLFNDIQLTEQLHTMVIDWLEGMSSLSIRRHWPNTESDLSENNAFQH